MISRDFSSYVQCFNFRDDNFLSTPHWFCILPLLWGAIEDVYLLPPIRVSKYGVNQELRKVDLKITLTKEIISRKIVVSRLETLYWQDFAWFHMKLLKLWELGMTWIFQFRTELKSDSVKWETLLSSVNLHWTITSEKLTTDWDKTKIKKTYNWGR